MLYVYIYIVHYALLWALEHIALGQSTGHYRVALVQRTMCVANFTHVVLAAAKPRLHKPCQTLGIFTEKSAMGTHDHCPQTI